jgi:hypothetical protein
VNASTWPLSNRHSLFSLRISRCSRSFFPDIATHDNATDSRDLQLGAGILTRVVRLSGLNRKIRLLLLFTSAATAGSPAVKVLGIVRSSAMAVPLKTSAAKISFLIASPFHPSCHHPK